MEGENAAIPEKCSSLDVLLEEMDVSTEPDLPFCANVDGRELISTDPLAVSSHMIVTCVPPAVGREAEVVETAEEVPSQEREDVDVINVINSQMLTFLKAAVASGGQGTGSSAAVEETDGEEVVVVETTADDDSASSEGGEEEEAGGGREGESEVVVSGGHPPLLPIMEWKDFLESQDMLQAIAQLAAGKETETETQDIAVEVEREALEQVS